MTSTRSLSPASTAEVGLLARIRTADPGEQANAVVMAQRPRSTHSSGRGSYLVASRARATAARNSTILSTGGSLGAVVSDHLAGRHVVVVDDDMRLLALARLALQKQGIRVSTAATAEDARKLVAADPPDLVILDIVLPDMSGWELLRQIRETDNCLVMLLSGRDSDIDKARGLDLGADDYLTKPFSFLEFEARVRALLRRAPVREPAGGMPAARIPSCE